MQTAKCAICGKRYKYPQYIETNPLRYTVCFTCEFVMNTMQILMDAIVSQKGEFYKKISEDPTTYIKKYNILKEKANE